MSRYIAQKWANLPTPSIFLHDDGYYVVKFQSMADQTILYDGPYTINYRPMILKQWSPELNFNEEFLTEIPLWVVFPKLPMTGWSCDSLSRLTSAIGTSLFADKYTTKQTQISFARVLIEVNVTKSLPT